MSGHVPAARARGVQAGLSVRRIVEAARRIPPAQLTITAVAESLGVDRKAVTHHVKDRQTLVDLTAVQAFSEAFEPPVLEEDDDWRSACRKSAAVHARSAAAMEEYATHLRADMVTFEPFYEAGEELLGRFLAAGFDDETAIRLLAMFTALCISQAASIAEESLRGDEPRLSLLRQELRRRGADGVPHLARIAASEITTTDSAQLDVMMDVFITGAERLLAERQGA